MAKSRAGNTGGDSHEASKILKPIINAEFLADFYRDSKANVRLIEVDVNPAAYNIGHIPGALLWNVYKDLLQPNYRIVERDAFADFAWSFRRGARHSNCGVRLRRRHGVLDDGPLRTPPCFFRVRLALEVDRRGTTSERHPGALLRKRPRDSRTNVSAAAVDDRILAFEKTCHDRSAPFSLGALSGAPELSRSRHAVVYITASSANWTCGSFAAGGRSCRTAP